MKIFANKISETENTHESRNVDRSGSKIRKEKKNLNSGKKLSENEIKEKMAAHFELSNTAKSQSLKSNQIQFGAGFMNADFKAPLIEKGEGNNSENPIEEKKTEHLLRSDVGKNDPTDSTTTEKLKTVLQKGAFNFNSKEREVLDKILTN